MRLSLIAVVFCSLASNLSAIYAQPSQRPSQNDSPAGNLTEGAPRAADLPGTSQMIRIENASDWPYNFQLGRTTGPLWTETITLAPHTWRIFPATPGETNPTVPNPAPITQPGRVSIRFPMAGGYISYRLLSGKTYTYGVNKNGFGDLNENIPNSPPPLTRQGTEDQRIALLRSNHCFEK